MKIRRFDYMPTASCNQKVLNKLHKVTKIGEKNSGPYTIIQVHVNGTITIQLGSNVTERINIWRVIPYHDDTS